MTSFVVIHIVLIEMPTVTVYLKPTEVKLYHRVKALCHETGDSFSKLFSRFLHEFDEEMKGKQDAARP